MENGDELESYDIEDLRLVSPLPILITIATDVLLAVIHHLEVSNPEN